MTRSRRYELQHDAAQDERRRVADTRPQPINLPEAAFGPHPLEFGRRAQVWAWVPFTDGRQWRLPGEAAAWNDRVVQFEWWSLKGGGTRSTTVWRQAVTVRSGADHNCDHFLPWLTEPPGDQRRSVREGFSPNSSA
ncbi:hypothetical protein [Microbacterium mangrovi]|uniref:hypothetical protein n=1 Tax=Microbacterium mangrovi TaxID=1348253 RepID=UPI00068C588A|nr:hypothetical protein [Microbacterium mangrovi]